MKAVLISATIVLGLAACSPKARDDTAQAADSIAADANATMATAVNTVDAGTDRALGAAEQASDNAGAAVDRADNRADGIADRAGASIDTADDQASAAADKAARTARRAAAKAKAATGRALERAGDQLQQ